MLRLGSDCSGYNAAGLALENIGVKYTDVFLCDIDPHVRKVLRKSFPNLGAMYKDITARHLDATPTVDLYTAGFPCQPYSSQGRRGGQHDQRGKPIVDAILQYLRHRHPRAFVLENVCGLVQQNREFFDWILDQLRRIVDAGGDEYYALEWGFMDAKDFGVPQSRRRVLIVGLSRCHIVKPFTFPEPTPTPSLNSILEPMDRRRLRHPEIPTGMTGLRNYLSALNIIHERGGKYDDQAENWCADLGASSSFGPRVMQDLCPCITRARAGGKNFYVFSRGRCRHTVQLSRVIFCVFKPLVNDKK